jgi:hypothetical protein
MPTVQIHGGNSVCLDTYVFQGSPDENYYGSEQAIVVGGGTNAAFRGFLKFDLGLIPNDATITSAILKLSKVGGVGTGARTIRVHRVTNDWQENILSWNTQPSYDASVVTSLSVDPQGSGVFSFNVTSLVQQWINGTVPNYGLMLRDANESGSSVNISFGSREYASKPILEVTYTIPSTGKKQVEVVGTNNSLNGSTTNFVIGLPSGVNQGDLLIAQIHNNASGSAISASTGWTKMREGAVNAMRVSVWYKYAGASESNPVFTSATNTSWVGSITAYRNVKAIRETFYRTYTNPTNSFSPPNANTAYDNALAVLLNVSSVYQLNVAAPVGFQKLTDYSSSAINITLFTACRYMYKSKSLTSEEMTTYIGGAGNGESRVIFLEPIANSAPTLTLTSPTNNQTLSEGNALPIQGTAGDTDNGNVVTVKYKINNGPTRAIASGVSDGSSPISFARTLTYSNKRLWDGSTDVAGVDLAEGVDHTLTVWAEDDQGGKSAEVTRKFRVIWNRPPTISGTNEDLGTIMVPPSKTYTVTEPEGNPFTITEKINGMVIRSFEGVAGREETVTIPHDLWIRLDLDTPHSLTVEATDSKGLTSTRTFTFTRKETHIEFMLDFDNPDVEAHFTLDGMPKRVLVTLERYLPPGSQIEFVRVCNNAMDEVPTWEDATAAVTAGRGYLFTNQEKTAENWRINIWVCIAKGTATERVRLDGYGGAFD